MKQLNNDDLEKVTGGTEEEIKPLEVDLPWWWKQPTDNNNPMPNDDPFESNIFSDDGTPAW